MRSLSCFWFFLLPVFAWAHSPDGWVFFASVDGTLTPLSTHCFVHHEYFDLPLSEKRQIFLPEVDHALDVASGREKGNKAFSVAYDRKREDERGKEDNGVYKDEPENYGGFEDDDDQNMGDKTLLNSLQATNEATQDFNDDTAQDFDYYTTQYSGDDETPGLNYETPNYGSGGLNFGSKGLSHQTLCVLSYGLGAAPNIFSLDSGLAHLLTNSSHPGFAGFRNEYFLVEPRVAERDLIFDDSMKVQNYPLFACPFDQPGLYGITYNRIQLNCSRVEVFLLPYNETVQPLFLVMHYGPSMTERGTTVEPPKGETADGPDFTDEPTSAETTDPRTSVYLNSTDVVTSMASFATDSIPTIPSSVSQISLFQSKRPALNVSSLRTLSKTWSSSRSEVWYSTSNWAIWNSTSSVSASLSGAVSSSGPIEASGNTVTEVASFSQHMYNKSLPNTPETLTLGPGPTSKIPVSSSTSICVVCEGQSLITVWQTHTDYTTYCSDTTIITLSVCDDFCRPSAVTITAATTLTITGICVVPETIARGKSSFKVLAESAKKVSSVPKDSVHTVSMECPLGKLCTLKAPKETDIALRSSPATTAHNWGTLQGHLKEGTPEPIKTSKGLPSQTLAENYIHKVSTFVNAAASRKSIGAGVLVFGALFL